jgi:cellulose synthase/poly-beta-1,6-N-acetylglucosamine synthase-like glycosyltransferase
VAFTDDDCRPEPDWLEKLLAAARRNPGGFVQGLTRPDPLERGVLAAPHVRTMNVKPVTAWAQTCNILYPRELIERAGGFDEKALTGEDTGLALRAIELGARVDAAPDAVVNHAVESHPLPGIMRENLKWRHLAYFTKEQPAVRAEFPLGIFWDEEHMRTTAALVGIVGARFHPALLVLAAPYVRRSLRRRGRHLKGRMIAAAELPGQLAKQGAEVLGLAAGSVRHRTLVL